MKLHYPASPTKKMSNPAVGGVNSFLTVGGLSLAQSKGQLPKLRWHHPMSTSLNNFALLSAFSINFHW